MKFSNMAANTLLAEFYLVISQSGTYGKANVRAVTKSPNLQAGEIPIKVKLKIPSKLFTTPTFSAEIEIPDVDTHAMLLDVKEDISRVIQENLGIVLHISNAEKEE